MFERNFQKLDEFDTKQDKIKSYKTFLKSIHQSEKEYPYIIDGISQWKGAPTRHTVASFGGYYNADNVWTVFIAYRCKHPKHTIQHSWSWDSDNGEPFNYRVMEFVN